MVRRRSRKKKKTYRAAVAKGDEPPDPISLGTATLIAAGLGTATAISTPFINKALAPKAPKAPKSPLSPVAGESTTLSAGQKVNAINTTPQGILADPKTGRSVLTGVS